MAEQLLTKDDVLNKLRAYGRNPDDDNLRIKNKIRKTLLRIPELLYALHDDTLEKELFDSDGNINWEWNDDEKEYEPLGEWDRYEGEFAPIRPFLFFPDTQTDVKNYLCYQVSFNEIPNNSKINKYTLITFTIYVHDKDRIDSKTAMPRHDLIASIIRERFNWSSIFGFQARLVSSRESSTDNNYVVRTLVFGIYDTNGMAYTPYGKSTYVRNTDYWQ